MSSKAVTLIATVSQLTFYSYTFPFITNLFLFFLLQPSVLSLHPFQPFLSEIFLKFNLGEGMGKFIMFLAAP